MNDSKYWARTCILDGCHRIAKPLSDYCIPCLKIMKDKITAKKKIDTSKGDLVLDTIFTIGLILEETLN